MVVRMRHNRSQSGQRRSHHALTAPTLSVCENCGEKHRPHHMCQECGFYKGRQVLDLKAQKEKRAARIKAKKEMIRAQSEEAAPSEAEELSERTSEEVDEEKK